MNSPWPDEVRRPDLVLEALADRHPFDEPHAVLALLTGPYEHQSLASSSVLWTQPPAEERARGRAADRAAAQLGLDRASLHARQRQILLPVVVRPGPSWWSWDETEVSLALRYCNQLSSVLQAGVIVVTPRGWYSDDDELWGIHPRAVWNSTGAA